MLHTYETSLYEHATLITTEPSLEEQVLTLQAQLAAANERIFCLDSEAVHPLEAYSGTEMIQALLDSALGDFMDDQIGLLDGFLSLSCQYDQSVSRIFGHPPRSSQMTFQQLS